MTYRSSVIATGFTVLIASIPAHAASADKASPTNSVGESGKLTRAAEVTAAPLAGTLFFSDGDRNRLDRLRNRVKVAGQPASETEDARSVINGYVKRSDGGVTVWVDGVAVAPRDGQLAARISAASVGTTLADVRISVADRALPEPGRSTPAPRPERRKSVSKTKKK